MLYNPFPLTSIPPSNTHPLTPADFIQQILVPQVGLLLIQDDLKLSQRDALQAMRESVQYGVAMFPHGGGDRDGEEMDVADRMMMERARRRRKELEVEEREENEAFERLQEREKEKGARERNVRGMADGKKRNKGRKENLNTAEEIPSSSYPRPQPGGKHTVLIHCPLSASSDSEDVVAMPRSKPKHPVTTPEIHVEYTSSEASEPSL